MRKLIATCVLTATLTAVPVAAHAVTQEESDAKGAWLTSLGVDSKRFADPDVAKAAFKAVRHAARVVKAAHVVAGQVGR